MPAFAWSAGGTDAADLSSAEGHLCIRALLAATAVPAPLAPIIWSCICSQCAFVRLTVHMCFLPLQAGIVNTLMGPGPFTVFAPDDEAMAALAKKLGCSKIELLSRPELPDILKYHAVAGVCVHTLQAPACHSINACALSTLV